MPATRAFGAVPLRADVRTESAPRLAAWTSRDVRDAMADPSFYVPAPATVQVFETHISWVFVAGDRAYKLKKPVTFPFLDYSSPEIRRCMCERELDVNVEYARDTYLGVRAVVDVGGRLALAPGDAEEAIEHVVEMRAFDQTTTLRHLVDSRLATVHDMQRLGTYVASMHAKARVAPSHARTVEHLEQSVADNLHTLSLLPEELLHPMDLLACERFVASFMSNRCELLLERAARGLVLDGHGDMRLEHVLVDDRIQIVDRIEFNDCLRFVDAADDLAFLVMELGAAGAWDLAAALVCAYRESGGDPGPDELIAFWACHRALIRAKIAYLQALDQGERSSTAEEARRLMGLAARFRWRARQPAVLIIDASDEASRSLGFAVGRLSGWRIAVQGAASPRDMRCGEGLVIFSEPRDARSLVVDPGRTVVTVSSQCSSGFPSLKSDVQLVPTDGGSGMDALRLEVALDTSVLSTRSLRGVVQEARG